MTKDIFKRFTSEEPVDVNLKITNFIQKIWHTTRNKLIPNNKATEIFS